MENGFKSLKNGGTAEIVEKKSRFIATLRPVNSEEEALAFFAEMKKKYYDARHNCTAFAIGANNECTRSSDDGEPSGTAGRPMLDVLVKEGVHNVAVVVTRYFGGTLLGTGGLVRAYQLAVQEGLKNCEFKTQITGKKLNIKADYTLLGKLQYILASEGLGNPETVYSDAVELNVMVPSDKVERVISKITEETNAKAAMELSDEMTYEV